MEAGDWEAVAREAAEREAAAGQAPVVVEKEVEMAVAMVVGAVRVAARTVVAWVREARVEAM